MFQEFALFVRGWGSRWFIYMSGAPSVPAAIAAVFVQSKTAQVLLIVTAIFSFVLASFFVWREQYRKTVALEETIRPKLKWSFSRAVPGCVTNTNVYAPWQRASAPGQRGVPTTYYRIKVEADKISHVDACYGRLLTVTRNGDTVLAGEILQLPFAPANAEDATSKTINEGVPEFLDVLASFNGNVVVATRDFTYPASINMAELFSKSGKYSIELAIVAPGTRARHIWLSMVRNEDNTIEISCADASESGSADVHEEPRGRRLGSRP